MISPLKLFSFWVPVSCVVIGYFLYFLVIPLTEGFVPWVFLIGILIAKIGPIGLGLLPNLIILIPLIDVMIGRLPKVVLLVPLVLYGTYYTFFLVQEFATLQKQSQLKSGNLTQVAQFDSQKYSLVLPNAASFISRYNIPIAYSRNEEGSGEFISYRLTKNCKGLVGDNNRLKHCRSVNWPHPKFLTGMPVKGVETIMLSDGPENDIIEVLIEEPPKRNTSLSSEGAIFYVGDFRIEEPAITAYKFFNKGEQFAVFKAAKKFSFHPLPLISIKCAHERSGKFGCSLSPIRVEKNLNTYRDSDLDFDINVDDESPVGRVLGISQYKDKSELSGASNLSLTLGEVQKKLGSIQ